MIKKAHVHLHFYNDFFGIFLEIGNIAKNSFYINILIGSYSNLKLHDPFEKQLHLSPVLA